MITGTEVRRKTRQRKDEPKVKRKTPQSKDEPKHKRRFGSKKNPHSDHYAHDEERKVTTRSGQVVHWK